MDYCLIKTIHITAVGLSGVGFAARFAGSLVGASWVRSKFALVLPHINDTLLLVTAITLAVLLQLNPLTQAWLLAKILALLVYIGLGMVALNPSRPRSLRLGTGVAALTVFAYIVSVALYKQPFKLFSWVL